MTNTYRIDRVKLHITDTPCGMNSILWLGDSYQRAICTISDLWHESGEKLILSKWNEKKREYQIIRTVTRS